MRIQTIPATGTNSAGQTGLPGGVITPSAAAANKIAAVQTPAGAVALTLSVTTLEMARILKVTDGGDNSARSLTFVGTDADGNVITEVVAGTSSSTAVTTNAYLTITSITADAMYSHTVEVGTVNSTLVGNTYTFPLDYYEIAASSVAVVVTGTINYTVQECFDDIIRLGTANATWFTGPSALAGKTANAEALLDKAATGIRLQIASFTTGATIKAIVIPGNEPN